MIQTRTRFNVLSLALSFLLLLSFGCGKGVTEPDRSAIDDAEAPFPVKEGKGDAAPPPASP